MARYDEEGRKLETPNNAVGADLSDMSVDELRERIETLREEIVRVEAAINRKNGSITAAESFFKT